MEKIFLGWKKSADFRLNSTGSSDYRRHFQSALMTKQGSISSVRSNINVFSLKPDVRRKRRSHCVLRNGLSMRKQRLNRSLDDLFRIANNNSRHEPFQALSSDWHQSWMMQTAEIYDIQIDLNSKWLWLFHLINSFPAYYNFLLKHSLSK